MKYIFTIVLFGILGSAFAQQYPKVSQYMINPDFLNPAAVGSRPYSDAKFSYRQQWAGVEGAPNALILNFNSPIYLAQQSSHIGVGALVYRDQIGDITTTSVTAAMSYHLKIKEGENNNDWFIAPGGSVGIVALDIDNNNIILNDPNDPTAFNQLPGSTIDFNVGLWTYNDHFFAGVAAQQIGYMAEGFQQGVLEGALHYNFMGGFRGKIAGVWGFVPSVLIQSGLGQTQVTPSMMVRYNDILWTGISYNARVSRTYMIGFRLENLMFNYAFEQGGGVESPIRANTHEVTLGIRFNAIVPNNVINNNIFRVKVRAFD